MLSTSKPKCLGILASGNGSNLQAIIDATNNNIIPDTVVKVVISDKKNAFALKRAELANIDNIYLNYKMYNSREEYDKAICEILNHYNVDLVVLAGYLKILTSLLINQYKDRILNIHPSLLPAFGGVNMYGMKVHQAVIDSKAKHSGCTVHIVTEDIDLGPIVDQAIVEVLESDTPETLANRILKDEHRLYPVAIAKYLQDLGSTTK